MQPIKIPIFKKYGLLIFLVTLISLLFCTREVVRSQFPSFEVYSSTCGPGLNCTPYPLVETVTASSSGNYLYVKAHIYDVSGVSAAVADIQDPNNPGLYLNSEYSFS